MEGIVRRDNVIYLRPPATVQRSRNAPGYGGWLVLLGALLVIAALSGLALHVEPQPLALGDDGRPSMLIQ